MNSRKRKSNKSKQTTRKRDAADAKNKRHRSSKGTNKRSKVASKQAGRKVTGSNGRNNAMDCSLVAKHAVPLLIERKSFIGPVIRAYKSEDGNCCKLNYSVINKFPSKDQESKDKQPPDRHLSAKQLRYKQACDRLIGSDNECNIDDWKCSLCQRKPWVHSLGDLYGPYYIDYPPIAPEPSEIVTASNKKKRVRKTKKDKETPMATLRSTEVWLHEDCTVWTSGLVMRVMGTLDGLSSVLQEAAQSRCVRCLQTGATLSCFHHNCVFRALHYPCAREIGCLLDENRLAMYCPSHQTHEHTRSITPFRPSSPPFAVISQYSN